RFVGGSPLMSGLRRVAHAPPWPGDHDRLACCAQVRGPAAPRRRSLLRFAARSLPRPPPRVRGLFGSQDEWNAESAVSREPPGRTAPSPGGGSPCACEKLWSAE